MSGVEEKRSVGEAIKDTQTGKLPIGTVEQILEAAPKDLVEDILEVPEWGCSVRVRSFTAAEAAAIKEEGFEFKGTETIIAWGEMEVQQFMRGVIEPEFSEEKVRELHLTSGTGFTRVTNWLEEQSNIDREKLAKLRDEFPKPSQPAEV